MNTQVYKYIVAIGLLLAASSCYKAMLPKEKAHFSNNCNFDGDTYVAYFGRANVSYGKFNPDYSTQPLTFELQNIQRPDGAQAPEFKQEVNTWQWKTYYSGTEKSVDEINAKRIQVKRPLMDLQANSGNLVFWSTDTTVLKPGIYTFDILVKNEGGQKLFQKRKLDLRRPRPYEPYEWDAVTGLPLAADQGGIIHPSVSGIKDQLNNELKAENINVYFRKTGTAKNTISFKFFDKDSLPIRLPAFNITKWDSLAYRSNTIDARVYFGFNRKMTADSTVVTWDIPNPFPVLADVGIDEKASINFSYERISYGVRTQASLGLTFALFEAGSWDVIIKFNVNPRFSND
ncbi:DUF5007 domain-containing protein [Chitinophaga polysaccharea]|uniref:DUF5007 domain-containing protein n=1 Tax=Chitinophaga TaxID=79328 RepID=UPI001455850C|nr:MULTISPECIES: DUF5007 domain-containing protein [Chitinophaga]NLR57324.1 DUF5007 domain-containing protein [Chitinophaga polysaccharea]NLU91558.1 DUF5007 domain-containing protein [Chitinophaga sp. Ak27]